MVRSTEEMYEVPEDTEEEASCIKIFLEEGALKPGHLSSGEGASQSWLPLLSPGEPYMW